MKRLILSASFTCCRNSVSIEVKLISYFKKSHSQELPWSRRKESDVKTVIRSALICLLTDLNEMRDND